MKTSGRERRQTVIILVGMLIFLAGAYLTGGLYPFEFSDMQGVRFDNWRIAALARDLGAVIAAAAVVIGGLRSVRAHGRSPGRILFAGLGYGIIAIFFVVHGVAYIQSTRILTSYDFSDLAGHIEKILAKQDLPDHKRQVLVKKLAESRYLQTGQQMRLAGPDQGTALFRPSKELIRFRQQNDQSRNLLGWIKKQALRAIFIWLAVLVAASAAGIFSPLDRKRLPR